MLAHFVLTLAAISAAPDDLDVLPKQTDAGPTSQTYLRRLQREAELAFERREKTYEALKTPEQITAYQDKLRKFFVDQIGGYPEKTPLNAQIVGRRDCDGYRLEKILFESQPKHYVSALLYLPTTPGPYPGVIVPCGHTADGKIGYFRISAALARAGFAALCYDPIGQGERYQLLDEAGKPLTRSTGEHTAVGVGSALVGRNTATYRIWDGMRAIDYLQSRDDVDGSKIGCTGISGGGTLTEYLMCLDDRITCAAPGCAINTFQNRVVKSKMGDAEQNIFGQIAFGLDHADYVHLRAPKPTLLLCATRDFVDIHGSWEIFREAKRIYARFGFSERIDLLEADEEHGFPKPLREQSVRWMRRWLMDKHDPLVEPEIEMPPKEDLIVTPRGQVQLLADARSVMDLNLELAEQYAAARREKWQPSNRQNAIEAVQTRIGTTTTKEMKGIPGEFKHYTERDGYTIEKGTFLHWDDETYPAEVPALLFRPKLEPKRRILYLNCAGKHVDATVGGRIERLVHDGAVVLSIDLCGCGEVGRGGPNGAEFNEAFMTYLLGKSLVGRRVDDIAFAALHLGLLDSPKPEVISVNDELQFKDIEIVAVGQATIPALHAVALDPTSFAKVTLRDMPIRSWLDVVRDPTLPGSLNYLVHGALQDYDLSDLMKALPEGVLTIEESAKDD